MIRKCCLRQNNPPELRITVLVLSDFSCFEVNFKDCTPTKVTVPLSDTVLQYYEIVGVQDNYCRVKSKFTAHTNLEWVDKEMICDYDNSLSFGDAVEDGSRCSGPLVDSMNGK